MPIQQLTEIAGSIRSGSGRYNFRPRGSAATCASTTPKCAEDKLAFPGTEEGDSSQAATHTDRFGLAEEVPPITAQYWDNCEFSFPALMAVGGDVTIKDGIHPTCDACFGLTTSLAEGTAGFEPNPISVVDYTTEAGTKLKRYPATPAVEGNQMTVRWLYQGNNTQIIAYEGDTVREGSGKDMMEHGKGQLYMSEVMPSDLPKRLVERALWQKSQASVT